MGGVSWWYWLVWQRIRPTDQCCMVGHYAFQVCVNFSNNWLRVNLRPLLPLDCRNYYGSMVRWCNSWKATKVDAADIVPSCCPGSSNCWCDVCARFERHVSVLPLIVATDYFAPVFSHPWREVRTTQACSLFSATPFAHVCCKLLSQKYSAKFHLGTATQYSTVFSNEASAWAVSLFGVLMIVYAIFGSATITTWGSGMALVTNGPHEPAWDYHRRWYSNWRNQYAVLWQLPKLYQCQWSSRR